jgi:hypothetical protein
MSEEKMVQNQRPHFRHFHTQFDLGSKHLCAVGNNGGVGLHTVRNVVDRDDLRLR